MPNRRAYASTGRLFDVGATGGLSAVQIAALRDVTVALAAEEYLDPGAFAPAAGESVSGPDFSVSGIRNGSPAGAAALRRAAGTLDRIGLRRLTARAMP